MYTMEYYSAIKKNTFESVLMRWMELEPIIQSISFCTLLALSSAGYKTMGRIAFTVKQPSETFADFT